MLVGRRAPAGTGSARRAPRPLGLARRAAAGPRPGAPRSARHPLRRATRASRSGRSRRARRTRQLVVFPADGSSGAAAGPFPQPATATPPFPGARRSWAPSPSASVLVVPDLDGVLWTFPAEPHAAGASPLGGRLMAERNPAAPRILPLPRAPGTSPWSSSWRRRCSPSPSCLCSWQALHRPPARPAARRTPRQDPQRPVGRTRRTGRATLAEELDALGQLAKISAGGRWRRRPRRPHRRRRPRGLPRAPAAAPCAPGGERLRGAVAAIGSLGERAVNGEPWFQAADGTRVPACPWPVRCGERRRAVSRCSTLPARPLRGAVVGVLHSVLDARRLRALVAVATFQAGPGRSTTTGIAAMAADATALG